MMRDGVCDDASNIAICLYDGGDCCKENKDKTLCGKCACMLDIDHEELANKFTTLEIKPVEDPAKLAVQIEEWTVEVEDVVSWNVCAVLCLNHPGANELNTWHYQYDELLCKCGWVHSFQCPEKIVSQNWAMRISMNESVSDIDSISFNTSVQLNKTVSCGMCSLFCPCISHPLIFECLQIV